MKNFRRKLRDSYQTQQLLINVNKKTQQNRQQK
jgi:hypothetical protein